MVPPDVPPAIAIDALDKPGERAQLGPGGMARLVRVAPFPQAGPPIVFLHGIGGDPGNQFRLIREAQTRGMRVWTMAYDTWAHPIATNADGFAEALRALAAEGVDDVTLVAHSLGALTTKGALDRLRRPDGHAEGFRRVRFVALSAPWASVTAANLARHVFVGHPSLLWARDLAPDSDYWRGMIQTPFAPEVAFYDLVGDWDSFTGLAWHPEGEAERAVMRGRARRWGLLARGTHNAPNWDPRAIAFVFDPDHAPDPASPPSPGPLAATLREWAATVGFTWAFRAPVD